MPAEKIIRHVKSAKLWLDQALAKYQDSQDEAAYWDLSLAEAEIKMARQEELATTGTPEEAAPSNVVTGPWLKPVKVAAGVAACLALGFVALQRTDYALRLVSPEEVVLHHPEEWDVTPPKFVEKIYITHPALAPLASPQDVTPPLREETEQGVPERGPEPSTGPRRESRRPAPKRPAASSPSETPAPQPAPTETAPAPQPADPPAAAPAPDATAPAKKPQVDVLELLQEAESTLR